MNNNTVKRKNKPLIFIFFETFSESACLKNLNTNSKSTVNQQNLLYKNSQSWITYRANGYLANKCGKWIYPLYYALTCCEKDNAHNLLVIPLTDRHPDAAAS